MIAPLVLLALVACLVVWRRVRAGRRRREAGRMVVGTYPEIELRQPYGGWDADAYDAHTGHDRSAASTLPASAAFVHGLAPVRRH
ncbi:hypothetical protein [uncultured Jatrophihabitans sp.]|uniref:hypothetical protein n=1 Tax=uncultured Jatrophihabitans sp. TaxID=1610747 RepID=UPI0035CA3E46